MESLDTLRADLRAEQNALDDIVAVLSGEQWATPTASVGWTIADQIGHLSFFDASAATAVLDTDAFYASIEQLVAGTREHGIDDFTLSNFRSLTPSDLLNTWRRNRAALNDAAAGLNESDRVPWYGPSMSAKSFIGARLMETWAHGADVVDALGVSRESTDRLRHIARLGFITRKWSYEVRGESLPHGTVRVELEGPDEATWRWGPSDADDVVTGPAEEFCLVVIQRRHVDDTTLVTGELGRHWLTRAQAFAGGPTIGPRPRSER